MPSSRSTAARTLGATLEADVLAVGLSACAPPPPTGVSVTPGDGRLTVAFTPTVLDPHPAGMPPTKRYEVAVRSGEFLRIHRTASSPTTIEGLENGRTYSIVVTTIGEGDIAGGESEPAYGTPRTVPGPVAA